MPFRELNNVQMDILKEISNIGMGHAATALSQMIGHPVQLRVPHITVTEISNHDGWHHPANPWRCAW